MRRLLREAALVLAGMASATGVIGALLPAAPPRPPEVRQVTTPAEMRQQAHRLLATADYQESREARRAPR